jgi:haloacetate dehalogenase
MTTTPDLFPGFETHTIRTGAGTIHARSAGKGQPLLLLHGFPQTHACWHRIAPTLAQDFAVVVMDLRGYGRSSAPESDDRHEAYSKRAMAEDAIAVMKALGHETFAVAGHDRGARVAYRMALDHPGVVSRLALLDIIPTNLMWERMDASRAMQVYHWTFLAQPAPMPENLIGRDPKGWLEHTLASWTAGHNLKVFSQGALAEYRGFFADPARIHATCEDYRAGATVDPEADETDRKAGRTITCRTLILWGEAGIPAQGVSPLDIWRGSFAPDAEGFGIAGGHFLPEESPNETLAALQEFFGDET